MFCGVTQNNIVNDCSGVKYKEVMFIVALGLLPLNVPGMFAFA